MSKSKQTPWVPFNGATVALTKSDFHEHLWPLCGQNGAVHLVSLLCVPMDIIIESQHPAFCNIVNHFRVETASSGI
jgi:hypothetical protein